MAKHLYGPDMFEQFTHPLSWEECVLKPLKKTLFFTVSQTIQEVICLRHIKNYVYLYTVQSTSQKTNNYLYVEYFVYCYTVNPIIRSFIWQTSYCY